MKFLGRQRELKFMHSELDKIRRGGRQPGRCVLLRGTRRVGKTRLAEEFCQQAQVPYFFYAASRVAPSAELDRFSARILASDLPNRHVFDGMISQDWSAALRLLAQAIPQDSPSVVVIDELPFLINADPGFEGTLQEVWDRVLSRLPVLLILVGSDLSMMEALNTYGRPFFQRGTPFVLDPLNPAEIGAMLRLSPAQAFDAYLVTGGLPLICAEWQSGAGVMHALEKMLSMPTSPLIVSAELSLAAEFPVDAHARSVLSAIGAGERTFSLIQRNAGELAQATFSRALQLLSEKRLIVAEHPISLQSSKQTRYRVTDPYLRFWLTFIGPFNEEINRGRADIVLSRISQNWTSWRGRVIEPIIRDALARLLPNAQTPWLDPAAVQKIGSYWTRTNDVEIDLVGADRAPIAKRIGFVGSIKWHEHSKFDRGDVVALIAHRERFPGGDEKTPLIAVSRIAGEVNGVDAHFAAADLINAWPAN